jgi:hypothetical protein
MEELTRLEKKLDSTEVDTSSFRQKAKDWYFEPKAIEKWGNGRVYELLGVRIFKKLLTNFSFYKRKVKTQENLDDLDSMLNLSELVHSPSTIIFGGAAAFDLSNENYINAAVKGIAFLINAYCTMLQRYNRIKTKGLRQRMNERQKRLGTYRQL